MKKIILFLLLLVSSNCLAQYNPQFLSQPPVGYQINLAHPDAQGVVGRWLYNEGSGFTLFDLSPHGNDGTLTGPMFPLQDWVAGRDGWALDFDGTNDHILVNNSVSLTITGSITMSIWASARTFPSFAGLFFKMG